MSVKSFLSDYCKSFKKEVGESFADNFTDLYLEDGPIGDDKSMIIKGLFRAIMPFIATFSHTFEANIENVDDTDGQGKMVVNFIKQGRSPIRLIIGAVAMIVTLVKAIVLSVVYFVLFALSAWIGRPLYLMFHNDGPSCQFKSVDY